MILVVGGAGYIGSHVVKELIRRDEKVIVLDNLSTGHRTAVDDKAIFIEGDLGSRSDVAAIFKEYPVQAVMHFAAASLVGESMQNPMKYYKSNVSSTLMLLQTMLEYKVTKFIFSSTAAVYGIPSVDFITEETPVNPINPYGRSKVMVEQMLADFAQAYGLEYVALRYFNAAGADETAEIGEDHSPETHLIPIVLQHLLGQRSSISVFGSDYPTPDGTCIRDYIHVTDLACAHLLALDSLLRSHEEKIGEIYNLGNGKGYSVHEIIRMCEKVTGREARVEYVERRPGDPPVLVASAEKAERMLGWKPMYNLEGIVQTAWKWHSAHPDGYAEYREK
jgi:UDP-glucose 4-epimerase